MLASRRPLYFTTIGAALAAFGVYRLTLTPGVALIDSGELSLAAWLPGNAHPPGTPLWVMLGYLFAHLPLGTVALRLNSMSAVLGALAVAVLALAAWLALPAQGGKRGAGEWALVAPAVAGLTFAFSRALWYYAVVTEVYTLHALLLAGVVAALLAWRRDTRPIGERSNRRLYLAAFLFGLAFTVHSATALVLLPGIAVLVVARDWTVLTARRVRRPARRRKGAAGGAAPAPARAASGPGAFWRMAAIALLCACAGLLAFAYLPLRAAGDPLLNWGNPSDAQSFWAHITAKYYQVFALQGFSFERFTRFWSLIALQDFYVAWLAAALGLWSLWRRDRAWLAFGALAFLANMLLFSIYDVYQDAPGYLVPALLMLALWAGEGAWYLLALATERAGGRRAWPAGAAALALLVPLAALAGNYRESDHSRDWLAEDFAHNTLAGIEPRGVLLTSVWDTTVSPLMYLQHVAGERRDATVIDVNLLRRSWYAGYVRQSDPALYAAVSPQYAAFLPYLLAWEHDQCDAACGTRIQDSFEALVNAFVTQANAAGRPVYVTGDVDISVRRDAAAGAVVGQNMARVPQGLAYRLYADSVFHPAPAPALLLRGLADGSVPIPEGSVADTEVRPIYLQMLLERAHYLRDHGDAAGAAAVYRQVLEVDPRNSEALAGQGQ